MASQIFEYTPGNLNPDTTTGTTEFQQSNIARTAAGSTAPIDGQWQTGFIQSYPQYQWLPVELTQDQKLRVRALELALSSLSYASSDALDRATVVHAIARKYYKFLTGDGE